MLDKTAIVNAKVLNDDGSSILNIGFQNQKITCLGYIPDDENFEVVDANQGLIIPNTFNLSTSFSEQENALKNDGVSTHLNFDDHKQLRYIPKLAYNLSALAELSEEITLVITSGVASEALFTAQELKKQTPNCHVHFVIETNDCETLDYVFDQSLDFLSFGLCIDDRVQVHTESLKKALEDERLKSFSTKDQSALLNCLVMIAPDSYHELACRLFSRSLQTLFPSCETKLSLSQSPNFAIIANKKELHEQTGVLLTVSAGKIYK